MAVNGILLGADTNSNKYLPLTGGTMTGPINSSSTTFARALDANNWGSTIRMDSARLYLSVEDPTKIHQAYFSINNRIPLGIDPLDGPNGLGFEMRIKEDRDKTSLSENLFFSLAGGLKTHVVDPTDDRMPTPKSYVDAIKPKAHKITLTTAGWADNQQTVTLTGVLADEDSQFILPTPAAASRTMYNDCDIQCITQATDSLTFSCATVPTDALSVYILLMDVTLS